MKWHIEPVVREAAFLEDLPWKEFIPGQTIVLPEAISVPSVKRICEKMSEECGLKFVASRPGRVVKIHVSALPAQLSKREQLKERYGMYVCERCFHKEELCVCQKGLQFSFDASLIDPEYKKD